MGGAEGLSSLFGMGKCSPVGMVNQYPCVDTCAYGAVSCPLQHAIPGQEHGALSLSLGDFGGLAPRLAGHSKHCHPKRYSEWRRWLRFRQGTVPLFSWRSRTVKLFRSPVLCYVFYVACCLFPGVFVFFQ